MLLGAQFLDFALEAEKLAHLGVFEGSDWVPKLAGFRLISQLLG